MVRRAASSAVIRWHGGDDEEVSRDWWDGGAEARCAKGQRLDCFGPAPALDGEATPSASVPCASTAKRTATHAKRRASSHGTATRPTRGCASPRSDRAGRVRERWEG